MTFEELTLFWIMVWLGGAIICGCIGHSMASGSKRHGFSWGFWIEIPGLIILGSLLCYDKLTEIYVRQNNHNVIIKNPSDSSKPSVQIKEIGIRTETISKTICPFCGQNYDLPYPVAKGTKVECECGQKFHV